MSCEVVFHCCSVFSFFKFLSVCTYDIPKWDLLPLFKDLTRNGGLCQTLLKERLICL